MGADTIEKKIKKGERFFIHLPFLKMSGYSWKLKQADQAVAKVKERNSATDDPVGGSAGTVYEVTGVKKGKTKLEFTLKRDWEEKEEERKVYLVEVV